MKLSSHFFFLRPTTPRPLNRYLWVWHEKQVNIGFSSGTQNESNVKYLAKKTPIRRMRLLSNPGKKLNYFLHEMNLFSQNY